MKTLREYIDLIENAEQEYEVKFLNARNALAPARTKMFPATSIKDLFQRLKGLEWYPLEINGIQVIDGKYLKSQADEVNEDAADDVAKLAKEMRK